jgi:hypothetical protein
MPTAGQGVIRDHRLMILFGSIGLNNSSPRGRECTKNFKLPYITYEQVENLFLSPYGKIWKLAPRKLHSLR